MTMTLTGCCRWDVYMPALSLGNKALSSSHTHEHNTHYITNFQSSDNITIITSKQHKQHKQHNLPIMHPGLPSFQGHFPEDQPPTLLHPASPKLKPATHAKEADAMSTMTGTSFGSTRSLLKSMKSKLRKDDKPKKEKKQPHFSHGSSESKETDYLPAPSHDGEFEYASIIKRRIRKTDGFQARARTAEAYMVWATTR